MALNSARFNDSKSVDEQNLASALKRLIGAGKYAASRAEFAQASTHELMSAFVGALEVKRSTAKACVQKLNGKKCMQILFRQ